jgi:hypothetical protein
VGEVTPKMSESDLLRCCLDLAKLYGWRTYHARPALTAHGYRTAVQGDGKGFPDLLMVRGGDLLAVELKGSTGKTTPEQHEWLKALSLVALETTVWRPADWHSGAILATLKGAA